ncbi:MAG TPA: PAS domain S-box protein [Roseiflexaceae bacterium]|nr:PAS domain S-box protein [Roseiflexaceae bacterium]
MMDGLCLPIGLLSADSTVLPHSIEGGGVCQVSRHQLGRWMHIRNPDALLGKPVVWRDGCPPCPGPQALSTGPTPRAAEQALRVSEARYRRLFEASMDAIVLTDDEGRYLDVNDAACRMFGYPREQLLLMRVADLAVPDEGSLDAQRHFEHYRRYGKETGTFVFYHTDGSVRMAGYSAVRLGPNLHQSILHDTTDQRRIEEDLRLSEERFRNAFTFASIGMALIGLDGRWLQVNRAVSAITGYSEAELLGMTFQDITHPDDLSSDLAQVESLLRGESTAFQMEKRYIRKDGQTVWILLSASLVRDAQGQPHQFVSQIQDISVRKRVEAALRAALAEKEVLLKEIHHRVKNNLQMVASLLRLQAEMIGDPVVRDIFRDSQNRINTMALTHEQLYGSDDLASVDLAHYLRRLVMQVLQSYERSATEIELELALDTGLSAPVDVMIPLGLILTELVSNSIKYAFRGRGTGQIAVVLRHAGGATDLLVGDNGVGLPADFDLATATTLGLQLVFNLADQLGATLTVDRHHGTWFRLRLTIAD